MQSLVPLQIYEISLSLDGNADQFNLLMIGTDALCRILVPVWPMFVCVLPHPAIKPFRPVKLFRMVGKHMGMMWFL